jgi:hypothetical protein
MMKVKTVVFVSLVLAALALATGIVFTTATPCQFNVDCLAGVQACVAGPVPSSMGGYCIRIPGLLLGHRGD